MIRKSFRLGLVAAAIGVALPGSGAQAAEPERELTERYAPVVRLQAQAEPCGEGEPFEPMDVRVLFGSEEVALRGPWDRTNLVRIGPTQDDLARGLFGYHLDLPGDPLSAGCSYEEWSRRITWGTAPTAYARVVGQADQPGELALQYWFFYAFNDYNNKHEGDWEMIQLVFEAQDAAGALAGGPVRVGYSQHEGAEQAIWGGPKLERLDGTHPVVHVSAGSHANHFEAGLYLGRSATEGVGCDDATGPSRELRPEVAFVPTRREAYLERRPWLGYEGRWGEKQPAFYNGPTGPNAKPQWTRPITWSREWRDRSYAVVGGRSLGPAATEFFCDAVGAGSGLLTRATEAPRLVLLGLLAGVGLLGWAASRTAWLGSAPLHLERRRAWGQILYSSRRMYAGHRGLFVVIGLVYVPVRMLAAALQSGVLRLTGVAPLVDSAAETNTLIAGAVLGLDVVFGLVALVFVQAACARAMLELDAARPITGVAVCRRVFGESRRLLASVSPLAGAVGLLAVTVVGIPVAVWLIGRCALVAQCVEVEGHAGRLALQRSSDLVRGSWWRSVSMLLTVAGVVVLLGPLLGALLLLFTPIPFGLANLFASVVDAIAVPFVAIATTYLFFDLRVRERLEPHQGPPAVLPAEV